MATGTRLSNTQEELLRKLLPQIAEMKLSEDADPDFIAGLEDMLIGKIREPIERVKAANLTAAQNGMTPGADLAMAGEAGGGLPPEMLMQLLAAPGGGGGIAPAAVNQRGLAPSPDMGGSIDELRRVLSQ